MDLVPLLTRAESLFHRFERTVQAIDKKNNFPRPAAHQRKHTQDSASSTKGKSPQRPQSVGYSTGTSASVSASASTPSADTAESKVISPELRELLSKEILWKRQPQRKSESQ